MKLIKYKFVTDSTYSLVSFGILAVSGVLLNVLIGKAFSTNGLGIYSQAIALYLIFSVITTFGLHISIVKYLSEFSESEEECKKIFSTGFFLILIISSFVTIGLFLLGYFYDSFYFNKEVTRLSLLFFLGLPLFSLNKLFQGQLNAFRKMKELAVIQSARWIFLFILINIAIHLKLCLNYIAYCFFLTEFVLLIYLLKYNSQHLIFRGFWDRYWLKKNFTFGGKSLLLGFMNETNNKIDVFFISFFLSNHHVGIYSFAAEIAKGFLGLSTIVQLNINPIISKLWAKKDIKGIQKYTDKVSRVMLLLVMAVLICAGIAYPIFVNIFMGNRDYLESIPIFNVLLIGVFLPSVYYFTAAYFAMTNHLNLTFFTLIFSMLMNLLLAYFLINKYGVIGAAISTSLTYFFNVLSLHILSKIVLGISIIKNPIKLFRNSAAS